MKKLNESTVTKELLNLIAEATCSGIERKAVNSKVGPYFVEFILITDLEKHNHIGLSTTYEGYAKIDGVVYDFRIRDGEHGTEVFTFELDETSLDSRTPQEKHICHCDYDKVIRIKGCQCGGR